MTDIASLGLKVDSSQVVAATDDLDKFAEASERAETAATDAGDSLSESGKKFEGFSDNLGDAKEGAEGLSPAVRGLSTNVALAVGVIAAGALAVGVLVKAYIDGAHESEEFAKAIALTGNAAGVTIGRLQVMAQELDDIRGTQAEATDALAAFVSTGKVAADDLVRFAAVGQDLERKLGVPLKEAAKTFAELADKPSKAAAGLQKTFNFLTPAVYDYIRAQEKAGDIVGAATTAQNAYASAQEKALKNFDDNVPLIVRGWRSIKDAASEAWDAMLGIGRPESPEAALKRLQEARGDRQLGSIRVGDVRGRGDVLAIRAADEEEKRLTPIVALRKQEADAIAEVNKQTAAHIEQQEFFASHADDFEEAQKRINAAWTSFDLSKIGRDLSAVVSKFENVNDELEAQRNAGLVSDEAYFAKRRELIQNNVDAEIRALRAMNSVLSKQDELSYVERIAAQNKIADNEQRILQLRAKSASQTSIISTQESKALRDTANAYEDAQASAERYVQTLIKRFQIESQGLGLGEKERQRLRERADLEARFEDRRQSLDRDLRRKDITQKQYDDLLRIERRALEESEDAYDDHYAELLKKQGSWVVGASEAFHNFLDDAQNVAKGVEEALSKGFDGAADSLVRFVTTGKGNFGDLIDSIMADLLRVEFKILLSKALSPIFNGLANAGGAILGGLGGFSGDLGIGDIFKNFGGGRAGGGPVRKGMSYLVNENTPRSEIFTAPVDGLITPSGGMGGGVTYNNTYHIASGMNIAQIQAVVEQAQAQTKAEIGANINRGRWKR